MKLEFKGMEKLMRNLNYEIRQIENRTHSGLLKAAIILQNEAEPGTPVDTSNLRHSWFTVSHKSTQNQAPVKGGFKGPNASEMAANHSKTVSAASSAVRSVANDSRPVVLLGYTANYAAKVHESVDTKFHRPGAHARWLYLAMQTAQSKMLEAIRKDAEIK